MNSVNILRHNFQEIYSAAHSKSITLIPNHKGTRIYCSNSFFGRLWRCFYWLASPFVVQNLCSLKLQKAMSHTTEIFDRELESIRELSSAYRQSIARLAAQKDFLDPDIHKIKKQITSWNMSTKRMFKLLDQDPDLLKRINAASLSRLSGSRCGAMKNLQRIIDAEGYIGAPIPYYILHKKGSNGELTGSEEAELEAWVQQINKVKTPKLKLFQVLSSILYYCSESGDRKENLERTGALAYSLSVGNKKKIPPVKCEAFSLPDKKTMKWRKTLQPGVKIPYGGHEIILGSELHPDVQDTGKIRVFTVENHPDKIAWIGQGPATLPIKQVADRTWAQEGEHEGIEPVQFIDMLCGGRVALVERLHSIKDYQWSRDCKTDPLGAVIISLVKGQVQKCSGKNTQILSASTILLKKPCDGPYVLRAIKPLTNAPFNFNQLEVFIADCAGKDVNVFKYLTQSSGLSRHRAANAYRRFLKDVLTVTPPVPNSLEANMTVHQIKEIEVWDRASEMHDLANKLCEKLMKETGKPEEVIKKEIYYYYDQSGTFSILLCSEIYKAIMKMHGYTSPN